MINYPNKKKLFNNSSTNNSEPLKNRSTKGRGMSLEKDINISNDFYRQDNRAIIYKKPTPIQVVKVDYPDRKAAKITEAYYKTPSTTDYNGIYRGKYIDFEAKETNSKTSFTFRNIHPHQVEHLQKIVEHGGLGFFIIRFNQYNETYIIDSYLVCEAFLKQKRQSLSYDVIKEYGILVEESFSPRLKYLDAVDKLYF